MTITEFLLARIAEDEAIAEDAEPGGLGWGDVGAISEVLIMGRDRLLAECEAKRRIVAALDMTPCPCQRAARCVIHDSSAASMEFARERYFDPVTETILRALASVYADHPDYRDEWRA